MKNKGFTLMELLGVIIILGVLILIAFPPLLNQIKKTKSGIGEAAKQLIIDGAKDYVQENEVEFETIEGLTYCISMETLIEKNFLNEKLKDENLNDIDKRKSVKMIYHNNRFDYEIVDTCTNYVLTRNNLELSIVEEDDGLYKSQTEPNRFIYRGAEPENYIELNEGTEETPNYVKYRIISFESDGTIKVLRNESIGEQVWDKRNGDTNELKISGPRKNPENTYCNYGEASSEYKGCNAWGTQDTTYYNNETLTTLDQDFFYKYRVNNTSQLQNSTNQGTVTKNSSLNEYLNHVIESDPYWEPGENLNNIIVEHSFDIGGIYYNKSYEGGDKGLIKEKEEQTVYTWKGKIGLFNAIEYVEASLNPTCTSVYSNYYYNENYYINNTQTISEYDDWPCSNRTYNWMPISIKEWILSPNSSNRMTAWYVHSDGHLNNNYVNSSSEIRPAFYLKADITLTGEGTETNPYRIVGE